MRKLAGLLFPLVLSSCIAGGPAFAGAISLPMERNLMTYAANYLGVPVPAELPEVRFRPQCQIQQLWNGNGADKCDGGYKVVAAYVEGTNVLYLSDDADLSTVKDQSILLHELTHYVQDKAGIAKKVRETHGCVGAEIEGPAYAAQLKWLTDQGIKDPWAELQSSPLVLFIATMCGEPWEITRRVGQ